MCLRSLGMEAASVAAMALILVSPWRHPGHEATRLAGPCRPWTATHAADRTLPVASKCETRLRRAEQTSVRPIFEDLAACSSSKLR